MCANYTTVTGASFDVLVRLVT
eukprot:SAG11_NODE_32594_length_282_cov_1.016393_1_plen_21_part_10